MNPDERPLDIRLVPTAVTVWAVTAVGIVKPGAAPVVVLVAVAATALFTRWGVPRGLRSGPAAVVAVAVLGTLFGVSVALRVADVQHHPITVRYGESAQVTVAATESPRNVGRGRMMFRAGLRELDGPADGMVVVFAPIAEFGELTAGRPVTFRARIGRPMRADLTVAVLTAVGAAYLLVLGATTLLRPAGPAAAAVDGGGSGLGDLVRGAGVSGLNPKALLLFLALLPQFTDPAAAVPVGGQILLLGLVHVLGCALVYTGVGVGARTVLAARPAAARVVSRVAGAAMVTLGAVLLASQFITV